VRLSRARVLPLTHVGRHMSQLCTHDPFYVRRTSLSLSLARSLARSLASTGESPRSFAHLASARPRATCRAPPDPWIRVFFSICRIVDRGSIRNVERYAIPASRETSPMQWPILGTYRHLLRGARSAMRIFLTTGKRGRSPARAIPAALK
jgi:hypothetical protein